MPRITDFFICMYVLGCKLSLVRLCDSDFGITPVDDITIGVTLLLLLLLLLLLQCSSIEQNSACNKYSSSLDL